MCFLSVQIKRQQLEPIQEETEQEDELGGSKTGKREDGDFPTQAGAETKCNEDDEEELTVQRPRRPSRSHSRESLPPVQRMDNQWEGLECLSLSEGNLADESTTPKQVGKGRRSTSSELSIKVGPTAHFCSRLPPDLPPL